jgi:hypothetical protein
LAPDGSFEQVRELYEDKRLHVPDTVYNAIRDQMDQV